MMNMNTIEQELYKKIKGMGMDDFIDFINRLLKTYFKYHKNKNKQGFAIIKTINGETYI